MASCEDQVLDGPFLTETDPSRTQSSHEPRFTESPVHRGHQNAMILQGLVGSTEFH